MQHLNGTLNSEQRQLHMPAPRRTLPAAARSPPTTTTTSSISGLSGRPRQATSAAATTFHHRYLPGGLTPRTRTNCPRAGQLREQYYVLPRPILGQRWPRLLWRTRSAPSRRRRPAPPKAQRRHRWSISSRSYRTQPSTAGDDEGRVGALMPPCTPGAPRSPLFGVGRNPSSELGAVLRVGLQESAWVGENAPPAPVESPRRRQLLQHTSSSVVATVAASAFTAAAAPA